MESNTQSEPKTELAKTRCFGTSTGNFAACWGVVGVVVLLGFAIARVAQHMLDAWEFELKPIHFATGFCWTLFMAYSEGYRGFQKGFSPRVASRAVYLRRHATWLRLLLAPLFCLGYFHSTLRRRITVTLVIAMVTLIVILFRFIPQPWRGVLDFGVVVGLGWGAIATVVLFVRFWIHGTDHDPEVIDSTVLRN